MASIDPFAGFGVWVDVFDYVPAFAGTPPPVRPDHVAAMAADGARTLYVQTARDDPRSPGVFADRARLEAFVRAAHDHDMQVVGWYLPTHVDATRDRARVEAMADLVVDGQPLAGVALDIEWIDGETDVALRNRRLVELTTEAAQLVAPRPLGGIVFPPVVLDVLNPDLWPDFPWRELEPHVDVWLPMAYWTYRDEGSAYRDPRRYTIENIERTRAHLADRSAAVHVIGGVNDAATIAEIEIFATAARDADVVGWSLYDWATTSPDARRILAAVARE
ncbi:MAG TPA: hypothetical protein VFZ83_07980 [Acidimicrobiia bacterium]|nr:hypothetical protein [Acidimicrobiia bacterium]